MGVRFQWLAGRVTISWPTSVSEGWLPLDQGSTWEEGCLHLQTAFFCISPRTSVDAGPLSTRPASSSSVFGPEGTRSHFADSKSFPSRPLATKIVVRDRQSHQSVHTLPSKRPLFDSTPIISVCMNPNPPQPRLWMVRVSCGSLCRI